VSTVDDELTLVETRTRRSRPHPEVPFGTGLTLASIARESCQLRCE
jgi:hypothetical protein